MWQIAYILFYSYIETLVFQTGPNNSNPLNPLKCVSYKFWNCHIILKFSDLTLAHMLRKSIKIHINFALKTFFLKKEKQLITYKLMKNLFIFSLGQSDSQTELLHFCILNNGDQVKTQKWHCISQSPMFQLLVTFIFLALNI